MGGNVREWTWDFPSYFGPEYAIDPTGPATGTERMTRGGSWTADLTRVRNAYRRPEPPKTSTPQIGFRIARTALQ
jgi:formylglycine-generating enzyme required for sulfatase activity